MRPTILSEVPQVVMQGNKKLTPKEVLEKVKEGYELVEKVLGFWESLLNLFSPKKYELKKVAK